MILIIMTKTKTPPTPSATELEQQFGDVHPDALDYLYPGASAEVAEELESIFSKIYGGDPDLYAYDLLEGNLSEAQLAARDIGLPGEIKAEQSGEVRPPRNIRYLERPTDSGHLLGLLVGVEESKNGGELVIGDTVIDVSKSLAKYVLSRNLGSSPPQKADSKGASADSMHAYVVNDEGHVKLTGE